MGLKRLLLAILLVAIMLQQISCVVNEQEVTTNQELAESEFDKQLKINKEALFKGINEQIRIDAAAVMLLSPEPKARAILLEALKQTENTAVRIAVCEALIQSTQAKESVINVQDFVGPLLELLITEKEPASARLAAEATLIFEYDEISKRLEKLATQKSLSVQARLNVIDALNRPDIGAISKLMTLLDDPEKQIADAAQDVLVLSGIPVSEDQKIRKQIIEGLRRQGKTELLRSWEIRRETKEKLRDLERLRDWWKNNFLVALDQLYNMKDDSGKVQLLAEHLASSQTSVKLWALTKAQEQRSGTGTISKRLVELGDVLIKLISDSNPDIRLKTAKLLGVMEELNTAEKLLEQIKIETDDRVRMELFIALGGTCHYALFPNAEFKISPEIRKQVMQLASEYLSSQELEKAQNGSDVMKKMLEQDGLTNSEVEGYLTLFVERYNREKKNADGVLRGELLGLMSGLCGQSVYNQQAKKLFNPLFEEGLNDKTNSVREAAVEGLIFADKANTIKKLRSLTNDSSAIIRERIINLAGKVGGKDDLNWLADKMSVANESGPAWQAMLAIFDRSEINLLSEWLDKFESGSLDKSVSREQIVSFLKIVERKINGEKDTDAIKEINWKLARLYSKTGEYEQAVKYLGNLYANEGDKEQKEKIRVELVDTNIKGGNLEQVETLLANRLLEGDLESNSAIVSLIDGYFAEPVGSVDPNMILPVLKKIQVEDRPVWVECLKRWSDSLSQVNGAVEPEKAGG